MKYSPYSFSKINLYEQCPRKYKFQYIDKLGVWIPNIATERGSFIHLLLENHTKDKKTKFKFHIATEEQQKECFDIFTTFLDSDIGKETMVSDAIAELSFGMKITETGLDICNYGDKSALFRGKIDHTIFKDKDTIRVIDFKTGKVSPFPMPLQLIMYAIYLFYKYPDVNTIETLFLYVEHLEEKQYIFKREHLTASTEKLLEKIITIENDETFDKKPSALCSYCDFKTVGLCDGDYEDNFFDKFIPN